MLFGFTANRSLRVLLLPISFLYTVTFVLSQSSNLPLNRVFSQEFERNKNLIDSSKVNTDKQYQYYISNWSDQSCFKPYLCNLVHTKKDRSYSAFNRKLTKESLFIVNDTADKLYLTLNPLFNFEFGKDTKDPSRKNLFRNTRGILIRGCIGKDFSFESSFIENQATFPKYINDFNNTYLVVPGQGRWKQFKKNGYDYAMASGYISYTPNVYFNFQAGTGKHFVGDGYRSLLLSDNSFNYPFVRITSTFRKIQYTNLFAVFMNLNSGYVQTPPGIEMLFQKKPASFQFLSWDVTKRIQIGLFQGTIWQTANSINKICLPMSYINPIIGCNAIQYGLRGINNVLLGSTLKIKLSNSLSIYSQYVADNLSQNKNSLHNKQGIQAGIKYYDAFTIRNLYLQCEYNIVRPHTYAHDSIAQNYSHYNQALAHPLGANFREFIGILNYRIKNILFETQLCYAEIGKDSLGRNYGNNIFNTDYSATTISGTTNILGQGIKTTLKQIDIHLGYLINPSTNLNVIVGISSRLIANSLAEEYTNYIFFGIRTSINNKYYDF